MGCREVMKDDTGSRGSMIGGILTCECYRGDLKRCRYLHCLVLRNGRCGKTTRSAYAQVPDLVSQPAA